MKSVMTLTPKEQRSVVRALGSLATIFGELAENGARPRRRKRKPQDAVTGHTRRTPARTRAGKNPLVGVPDDK